MSMTLLIALPPKSEKFHFFFGFYFPL